MEHEYPKYLIRVPNQLSDTTDHWLTQTASRKLLVKCGIAYRDVKWSSGDSDGIHNWVVRCDEQFLTVIALHGCQVVMNVSKQAKETALHKLNDAIMRIYFSDNVYFSDNEREEVPLIGEIEKLLRAEHTGSCE